jgi:HPt (histidine-containing phosphotransfer) domain-containing protein
MALQQDYALALPEKCTQISAVINQPNDITPLCHKIAGSSGTYGFKTLGLTARWFEENQHSLNSSAIKRWFEFFTACCEAYSRAATVARDQQFTATEWGKAQTRADQALLKVWQKEESALARLCGKGAAA